MREYKKVTIFGIPFEGREDFISGTSLGPSRIRWALESIEDYSLYQRRTIPPYEDVGDILVSSDNREEFIETVKRRIDGLEPPFLALGGNHLVTLPIIKSLSERFEDFYVIHLDAHLDRRDIYEGERLSYATVIKRVEEVIGRDRVITLGYRSKGEEEEESGYPHEVREPLEAILQRLNGVQFYLTLDLDVLDPSEFPAVTNPEAGGISFIELLNAIKMLRGRLISADVVEFNPLASPEHFPAVTASLIIRELLIVLAER